MSSYSAVMFDVIDNNPLNRLDYSFVMEYQNLQKLVIKNDVVKGKIILKEFIKGKTPDLSYRSEEGEIPFIAVENMDNQSISKTDVYYDYYQNKLPSCDNGDILMVVDGSGIGKVAINYIEKRCNYIESMAKIVLDQEIITTEYFELLTMSPFFKKQVKGFGTFLAVPHLPYNSLSQMYFPLPSISQQLSTTEMIKQKIKLITENINRLKIERDKFTLFKIIDLIMKDELNVMQPEYRLDKYNQVNSGRTNIIFNQFENMNNELDYVYNTPFNISDEIKSNFQWAYLQDLLDVKISTGAYAKKIDAETGYCRIMVKNLSSEDENMKTDDIDNISESDYLSITQVNHLKYGDILFSGSGAGGLGNMVINLTDLKGIIDSHVGIIRLKESVNQLFIYYYLTSYLGQQQILRCVTGTTGQISINLNKLKKVVIPLLSDEDMKKIIEKINQEKEHSTIYDEKINALQGILDLSLDEYILHGYSEDLFTIPQEVMA